VTGVICYESHDIAEAEAEAEAESEKTLCASPTNGEAPPDDLAELKSKIRAKVKRTIIEKCDLPTAPWNAAAEKKLSRWVKENPSRPPAAFRRCLDNWASSDNELANFGRHPKFLLAHLSEFAAGPKRKFSSRGRSRGRGKEEGNTPPGGAACPEELKAIKMLNAFASVGAKSFDLAVTNIDCGKVEGGSDHIAASKDCAKQ
jgi:hypothetical protein